MDQKKTIRPFSMKDKIGYTLGDLGCCFTEQYRAMYLSFWSVPFRQFYGNHNLF